MSGNVVCEWRGKKYKFAPFDRVEVSGRFSAWLYNRILDLAEFIKPTTPGNKAQAERYQGQVTSTQEAFNAGAFNHAGPYFIRALFSDEGLIEAFYLCLSPYHPNIDRDTCRQMIEDAKAEEGAEPKDARAFDAWNEAAGFLLKGRGAPSTTEGTASPETPPARSSRKSAAGSPATP